MRLEGSTALIGGNPKLRHVDARVRQQPYETRDTVYPVKKATLQEAIYRTPPRARMIASSPAINLHEKRTLRTNWNADRFLRYTYFIHDTCRTIKGSTRVEASIVPQRYATSRSTRNFSRATATGFMTGIMQARADSSIDRFHSHETARARSIV